MNEDEANSDILAASHGDHSHDISLSHVHNLEIDLDSDGEYRDNPDKNKNAGQSIMRFQSDHPLSDSHGIKYIINNSTHIPNLRSFP